MIKGTAGSWGDHFTLAGNYYVKVRGHIVINPEIYERWAASSMIHITKTEVAKTCKDNLRNGV